MVQKSLAGKLSDHMEAGDFSTLLTKAKSIRHRVQQLIIPEPEFTKRIVKRAEIFWGYPGGSKLEMPLLTAQNSWEEWKGIANWQRLISNKSNSREFAKKLGCRVPFLYWKGKNFSSIDFDVLPENYVIKPTLGKSSNFVFLMRGNFNLFDGKTYSHEDIISKLNAVHQNQPEAEFMIEEFLATEDGEFRIHNDYKFYMFNGKVACIRLINRKGAHEGTNRYYNENWEPIPSLKKTKYGDAILQPPPACLPEMTGFAKTLSQSLGIFIRVDLYATREGAVFGEFAPTPSHGSGYSRAGSKFLIEHWEENCKGMI